MKSITIKDICFGYRKDHLLFEHFSLQLSAVGHSKVTAIMGASGAGKTTLFSLLLGMEKPKQGKITLYPDNPVIAYVPQEPVLFEHLSINQNARYFEFAGNYRQRFNEVLYYELVEELSLTNLINSSVPISKLSGGQKQRLSLLRALSINPDFILLDEPCNGLDAEVKKQFLARLRRIAAQYDLFVLYVTHHKLEAQIIADDIVYLIQQKPEGVIRHAAIASVSEFIDRPPVLDAAHIFRFPEVKILPIFMDDSGNVTIASNKELITHFWLVKDENVLFSKTDGWPFRIVSQSPMFCVLRHDASDTEWMFASILLEGFRMNEEVKIKFSGSNVLYNRNGLLADCT